ncbi:hypothetical protein ABER68_21200 [Paenibacillus alvei]
MIKEGRRLSKSVKKRGVTMNKSYILLDIEKLNKELCNNRARSLKIIKRLQKDPTNLMLKRRLKRLKLDNENVYQKQKDLWALYKRT